MIRLAEASDAAAIAQIYEPVVSRSVISFELVPPTPAEMAERIAATLGYAPWLVWVEDDRVAGYAYGSRHNERAAYQWSANVSVYIGERHRRQGLGRALYTSLLALLRLQGFHAAHGGITLPNAGSVGLHEALGFRPVALYPRVGFKFGAWHDVGWWQLELRARVQAPAPLLSLDAAQRLPEWREALASGVSLLRRERST
jgi:phosphinothricin acetyltransferase